MKTVILISLSFLSFFMKAQEKAKDTLFFKYDKNYIITHVEIPNSYYIKDGSGINIGNFYFTELKKIKRKNEKVNEICLEKFIRTSKFYDKKKNIKLNDYSLCEYFNGFVIVLVKNAGRKKDYIQVQSRFEVE